MKLILFSDSHGMLNSMQYVLENEKPEVVIHCGDYDRDANQLKKKFRNMKWHIVAGNGDFGRGGNDEEVFTVCGKRFFITHGHLHGVKRGYMNLIYAAMEKNADVVVFGHTHIPFYEKVDGMHVINPGSITFGARTYGILEISENGEINYTERSV